MISESGECESIGLAKEQLQIFTESAAVLGSSQLIDRGELDQLRVLQRELIVHGQNAFSDFEADCQLVRVRRFDEKVVGAARRPVSRSSLRSREVSKMMKV